MKKTKADPTGQRANRAQASKKLQARLKKAKRSILTLFRSIPATRRTVIVSATKVVYGYDVPPDQAEILNNQIRSILNASLDTQGDTMPMKWWFQKYVELPVRQGELEGLNEMNRLISIADSEGMVGSGGVTPQRIAPEVVLSSKKYLDELRNVYMENFQVIKTLSDTTAGQVIGVINRGIKAGNTPTQISEDITDRFNVSEFNADRIARTEVNRAFTDAKIRAVKTASDISGLNGMVRHISALLPDRTRASHAARHYLVYTTEEQELWWNEDANRINCLCHVRSILIDDEGNYIEA